MITQENIEVALLKSNGFFRWGYRSWIHEDDLGWVLTQDEAVEFIISGGVS